MHYFSLFLVTEPNGYRTMAARSVNSSRLAQDYSLLKTLLQSVRFYSRANLYGPNIGRPRKNAFLLLDGWVSLSFLQKYYGLPVCTYLNVWQYVESDKL